MKKILVAIALIVGTVIGAGVFGIPYAVSRSGFLIGLIHLIGLGAFVTLMTLYVGEVILRTKAERQFTGLAEKYLGRWGKWAMFFSMIFGLIGALLAYLVGIGESIAHLIGGHPFFYSIIFFIIAAPIIFYGLKSISYIGLGLSAILVLLFLIISSSLLPEINISNILKMNFSEAMFPYGVVLFAMLGYSIIPEIEMILKHQKKDIFSAIVIAMSTCIFIYILFSLSMVGKFGENVSEIATESLNGILHILGTVVAVVAMATGFLSLGLVLKDTFILDLKFNKLISWLITCFTPLLLLFLFSPSFVTAVGITGSYAGGITGILCGLMAKEARKRGDMKPEFIVPGGDLLIFFSILIFIGGIIYQTIAIFGII